MFPNKSGAIALNRVIAFAQLDGPGLGLQEIRVIHDLDRLSS